MNGFLDRYFNRIGLEYSENLRADFGLLEKIQYAHVTHIPYENIDILRGIPINLDTDALYEKIIVNGRGGYCFELNGLYARLLRELGYKVEDKMARFLRGETAMPMRRHRILCVEGVDGIRSICDAGVGTISPRHPLPLEFGKEFLQFGETYRLRKDEIYGTVVEELYKGEWRDVYGFTDEAQYDLDYIMPSFYCEKHPDSIFNKSYMLSLKTETGRHTLDGNIYKEFVGEEISLIRELSEPETVEYLSGKFYTNL